MLVRNSGNAVTTDNPSQNRKLMGEGAKNFLGGIAEKTDGSAVAWLV